MSDKQREDHVQAKYWNGFITRVEAQKVFDQYAQVLQAQAVSLQKMDAAISFMAEKFGVTHQDIEKWIEAKVKEAEKTSLEKAVERGEALLSDANGKGHQGCVHDPAAVLKECPNCKKHETKLVTES